MTVIVLNNNEMKIDILILIHTYLYFNVETGRAIYYDESEIKNIPAYLSREILSIALI